MTIIKEGSVSTDLQVDFYPSNFRSIIRAIREAIIAENDATSMYEKIVDGVKNQQNFEITPQFVKIAEVLQDIANEEKVHIGELQKLLTLLDKGEVEFYKKGVEEVWEL